MSDALEQFEASACLHFNTSELNRKQDWNKLWNGLQARSDEFIIASKSIIS